MGLHKAQALQLLSRVLTLVRCSFPPEPLVQMMRCLEKRKHCRSPSFLRDRDPRRPLVILPFSDMGTWMREPVGAGSDPQMTTMTPMTLPSGPALEVEEQPQAVVEQGSPNTPITPSSPVSEPGDGDNESSLWSLTTSQPGTTAMASKGTLKEMESWAEV